MQSDSNSNSNSDSRLTSANSGRWGQKSTPSPQAENPMNDNIEDANASKRRRTGFSSTNTPSPPSFNSPSPAPSANAPRRGRPKAAPRPAQGPPRPILPAPVPRPTYNTPAQSSGSYYPDNPGAYASQTPPFFHGPTNLPPQPYQGSSPMTLPRQSSQVERDQYGRLPIIEARINRLENALERYVDQRGEQALERSNLPRQDNNQR